MKVLIVTIEGGGNIPPILDTVKRLKRKGHDVVILSEPWLRELAEQADAQFIPFSQYFTKTDRKLDIMEDWKNKNNGFERVIFGPAKITFDETLQVIRAHAIDVVIADVLMPAALIAAEVSGVRSALLFHMPEYLPGRNRPPGGLGLTPGTNAIGKLRDRALGGVFNLIFDKYLKRFNAIRTEHELPKLKHLADLFHAADLRIIQTSEAFDFPILPRPNNVRYTGPVLDDPDWVSPWVSPWEEQDQRPLVVVSLSTTFQNQSAVIQNCINALGQLECRGLVTLGLALENEAFSTPENVKVVSNASHAQVFPHADVLITHAGHGTVMRAFQHGLPMVCLPMGRDQGDNAAKVVWHKAGIALSQKAAPKKIAHAVGQILRDANYKKEAAALGAQIAIDAERNTIVEALEALKR